MRVTRALISRSNFARVHRHVALGQRQFSTPPTLNHQLHASVSSPLMRAWQAQETTNDLATSLMLPLFINDGPNSEAIESMPGHSRHSVDLLIDYVGPLVDAGLKSVLLFGVVPGDVKDARGSYATDPNQPVVRALHVLKQKFPELFVATDVCLCGYTDHGHCGVVQPVNSKPNSLKHGTYAIHNPSSIRRLAEISLLYAEAGSDMIAPSDMMDGRIAVIKEALLASDYRNIPLMSYSAKFASALYGPFRDAACSGMTALPGLATNRQGYQLPVSGRGLALRALERDLQEGADMLMIKPGGMYLDVLRDAATLTKGSVPLSVYQVSGEYAMILHGAKQNAFPLDEMVLESFTSFRRAGATMIASYFTPNVLTNNWSV